MIPEMPEPSAKPERSGGPYYPVISYSGFSDTWWAACKHYYTGEVFEEKGPHRWKWTAKRNAKSVTRRKNKQHQRIISQKDYTKWTEI